MERGGKAPSRGQMDDEEIHQIKRVGVVVGSWPIMQDKNFQKR